MTQMVWALRHLSPYKEHSLHYFLLVFESFPYYSDLCCYSLVHYQVHSIRFSNFGIRSLNDNYRSRSNEDESLKTEKNGKLLNSSIGILRQSILRNKVTVPSPRRHN